MTQMPAWLAATIRYIITITGILLVANDTMPQTSWDQIAAATLSLVTAIYGVAKTNEIEQDRDAVRETLAYARHLEAYRESV